MTLALSLALPIACRGVPGMGAMGDTPAEARANADTLFGALAARFTDVHRSPRFARARSRLIRGALSPSRVFGDTSIWTAELGDTRELVVHGAMVDGHYAMASVPRAPRPSAPGESRHTIFLTRFGDGGYAWDTGVEFAIGPVSASGLAATVTALLAEGAGRTGDELRADYRGAFPRTTAVLGELFAADSLRATRRGDGATTVALDVTMRPDGIRARLPHFAAFLDKYVGPSSWRLTMDDVDGARWLDARGDGMRAALRLAAADGRLAPLDAPPRPMPDSLRVTLDLGTHIALFDVGVEHMRGTLLFIRAPHERGWLLRFDEAPEWKLPLAVGHLLRGSLARPFEPPGMMLRITARDSAGAETLLTRGVHVAVRESAIIRWLGALGSSAADDFVPADAEQDRWLRELLQALQRDTRRLLTPGEVAEEGGR